MGEVIDHSESCCAACAAKISETHEAIAKIAEFVSSINFDELAKNPMLKMLGLGKK